MAVTLRSPTYYRANPISLHFGRDRPGIQEHGELAAACVRGQHGFEHCERDPRLVGQARDGTSAGIQLFPASRGFGQRIVRLVKFADAPAISPV